MTGYLASSVTIQTSLNGATLGTFTPAAGTWKEIGHGLYELTVPASQLGAEGAFAYRVVTNDGLSAPYYGFGVVVHRTDQWEVKGSPQYNEVTQGFSCMIALHKNGQVVSNPASAQVWLNDTSGNTPVNITSVSPNADGVFVLTAGSIVLTANMNYEMKMQIVDGSGATWTSVDFALSFN
jgi:hypothetical protein